MARLRPFTVLILLTSFAAHAQYAMPIRPPRPTVRAVAQLWKGRSTGQVPREISVVGCVPDDSLGAIAIEGCLAENQADDARLCGAAFVDLKKGVIAGYLPAHDTRHTDFQFIGSVLIKSWGDGVELRFGKKLEGSKVIPNCRVLGPGSEPGQLLLAIGDGTGERLASIRVGAGEPVVLSESFQTIDQLTALTGTSLMTAMLSPSAGGPSLLVFDAKVGKTVVQVKGAVRHALSPDGMQLYSVVEVSNADGTKWSVVHQLDTRGAKTQRLPSPNPISGTAAVAAAMKAGRAALGGNGVVDLVSLSPLAQIALVHPFGPSEKIPVHTLRWSADGERLFVFAGQYNSETQKMRQLGAEVDGADGKVLRTWDALTQKPPEGMPGEVVSDETIPEVRSGSAKCESAVEGIAKERAVVNASGTLVPSSR